MSKGEVGTKEESKKDKQRKSLRRRIAGRVIGERKGGRKIEMWKTRETINKQTKRVKER